MSRRILPMLCALILLLIAVGAAQEPSGDRYTIPLSQPDRPVRLEVNLHGGSVVIKGGAVKTVLVESRIDPNAEKDEDDEDEGGKASGLRRIPIRSSGLTIEEYDNVVSVGSNMGGGRTELIVTIQVPSQTSAKVHLINGGDILVEGVSGELEVQCTNGGIDLKNVGGSVVANAINGHLHATLNSVAPGKPMSFSSLNGDIDVTLPADTKGSLSMKADMGGDIFTDFDLKLATQTPKTEATQRDKRGRYRVSVDRSMRGELNGGGPEFTFKTFQGNIFLRKQK